jgi:hypothetical protein
MMWQSPKLDSQPGSYDLPSNSGNLAMFTAISRAARFNSGTFGASI